MLSGIIKLCLQLKDNSDEMNKLSAKKKSASIKIWKKFAKANNLIFISDYGNPRVYGTFRGYNFSLEGGNEVTTIKLIRKVPLSNSEKRQNNRDIMDRFWAYYDVITSEKSLKIPLNNTEKKPKNRDIMDNFWAYYDIATSESEKSEKNLEINSEEIIFTSKLIENEDMLQLISDQLVNLIEIYPDVCKMGGEVVDSLLQAKHFNPIIWQIIKAISAETTIKIKSNISLLLCKKCFNYCSSHKVRNPSAFFPAKVKYYGCRLCRQSRDFYEGRSIAVLDNQVSEELSAQDSEILVNWLIYPKPFDFHEVRIIQASDREVEEFVMQVGNDMDEFRQPRYKKMPCIVNSECKLSANTLRILQHTFRSVVTVQTPSPVLDGE